MLHALPSVILGLFLLFFFHFAQIAGVDFGSGKANTNIKTILFISFFINAGIGLILIFTNAAIPMVLLAQGAYSSVVIIAELVVFNKLKSV